MVLPAAPFGDMTVMTLPMLSLRRGALGFVFRQLADERRRLFELGRGQRRVEDVP